MRGYSSYGSGGFSAQDTPFTTSLIALNLAVLLGITFRVFDPSWLALSVPGAFTKPWTLLTYPLVSFSVFGLFFYGIWVYFIGSALERSWGTVNYAIFFLTVTIVSGIAMEIGALVTHTGLAVDNWLPMAGVTLAFCLLMPGAAILLLIFRVQARWLGWLEMFIVFFTYAGRSPLLGIFALAGCGIAWIWVRNGLAYKSSLTLGDFRVSRPRSKHGFHPQDHRSWQEKINPIEWWKRHKRRKQFERLMRKK